jgi:hypothetical protein
LRGVVVEREQPGRLGVDLAAIVDRQPVAARRDLAPEAEGGGLLLRVLVYVARVEGEGSVGIAAAERHVAEFQVGRVEGDPVGRLKDLDVDVGAGGEAQVGGVRSGVDRILERPHVGRQLGRDPAGARSGRSGGGDWGGPVGRAGAAGQGEGEKGRGGE